MEVIEKEKQELEKKLLTGTINSCYGVLNDETNALSRQEIQAIKIEVDEIYLSSWREPAHLFWLISLQQDP